MKTIMKILGLSLVILVGAGFIFLVGVPYYFPPTEAGLRAATADTNDMVEDHAGKISDKMASPQGQAYKTKEGEAYFATYKESRWPMMDEIAQARALAAGAEARARGEHIPDEPHTLLAKDPRWVDAHTPVGPMDCVAFEASGNASFRPGVDPKDAHPDGMNPNDWSQNSRDLDRYKHLYFPGAWWGAIIGKICDANNPNACGPEFFVGSHKVFGGAGTSAGKLWIKYNGYTTPGDQTDYEGGYDFGHHDLPQEMCGLSK